MNFVRVPGLLACGCYGPILVNLEFGFDCLLDRGNGQDRLRLRFIAMAVLLQGNNVSSDVFHRLIIGEH